ncbi:hypothetical protein D6C78_02231 [Aureobasidium pullulans]|uniref:Transcription factor domain-containing protein n=2 Tax=Aureobasidium pullulans TaxID=5580 RepID=A0A4V4LFR2_AURPU|nr:hypothetical protein D6C78_02231 [Aureobasidium pullulans]
MGPSWDEKNQLRLMARQLYARHQPTLPPFTELSNEDERERKALTQPPGTFNVILTPDSFGQLPEYGGLIRRYRSSSGSSLPLATFGFSEDPNLIVLSEFEDTPYFMALPERKNSIMNLTSQITGAPSLHRGLSNYGTADVDEVMTHYKDFISRRMMPLGSRFKLSDYGSEDIIVQESRTFRPLYHAICAITLLSLALKGQRHLLAGAFQHYHQAISACMTSTNMSPGSLIYLHFILLLYDICCATQNCSPDGVMWSQHFQQLARLAYSRDNAEVTELQAYILWYTLFLDAQSCLAGNTESGCFVRAYLMHGSTLPTWRKPESTTQQPNLEIAGLSAVSELSSHMCTRLAELSQIALQMRDDVEMGRGSIAEHQATVTRFRNELYSSWNVKYPAFLPRDSPEAGTRLPTLARTVFDFASIEYSTAMVYMHTSMYRGQRLHNTSAQRKEIASHCRHILAMAALVIAEKGTEQHHIIFSVFLAGVNSSNDHDKNRAIGIIRAMEGTGISCNVTKSRELLEMICAEQRERVQFGGSPAEIDWVSYARERDIRLVNLGL